MTVEEPGRGPDDRIVSPGPHRMFLNLSGRSEVAGTAGWDARSESEGTESVKRSDDQRKMTSNDQDLVSNSSLAGSPMGRRAGAGGANAATTSPEGEDNPAATSLEPCRTSMTAHGTATFDDSRRSEARKHTHPAGAWRQGWTNSGTLPAGAMPENAAPMSDQVPSQGNDGSRRTGRIWREGSSSSTRSSVGRNSGEWSRCGIECRAWIPNDDKTSGVLPSGRAEWVACSRIPSEGVGLQGSHSRIPTRGARERVSLNSGRLSERRNRTPGFSRRCPNPSRLPNRAGSRARRRSSRREAAV